MLNSMLNSKKILANILAKEKLTVVEKHIYAKILTEMHENESTGEENIMKTREYRNSKSQLHREDGPAVERTDGTKAWYLNGKRHREDGPAIEDADGYKSWYLNGKRHREDGPAIEFANGTKAWYLDGEEFTEEEFNSRN